MSVGTSETKYGMAFRRLTVQSLFSDQSLFNIFHFIRLLRPTSVMSYPMLDIANEGGAKVPHLSEGSSLFLQDLQFLTDPTHENDWKQRFSTIWFEEWIQKNKIQPVSSDLFQWSCSKSHRLGMSVSYHPKSNTEFHQTYHSKFKERALLSKKWILLCSELIYHLLHMSSRDLQCNKLRKATVNGAHKG